MTITKTILVFCFESIGDFSSHDGIFPGCGTTLPFNSASDDPVQSQSGCC